MLPLAVSEEPRGRPWRQVSSEWRAEQFCTTAEIGHSGWLYKRDRFQSGNSTVM